MKFLPLAGVWLSLVSALLAEDPAYRIENSTILTSPAEHYFTQSRAALIPGNPVRVIMATQAMNKTGTHGYGDLYQLESSDGGLTWTQPSVIESLRRTKTTDGYDLVIGDVCPQWHAASKTVLATGKTFGFRGGTVEDRSRERVSYATYSPTDHQWSGLKILGLPEADHEGKGMLEANAGCHQRLDLANGEILLPVRYRKDPKTRQYTTIVARCTFDGKTLTYGEHGSELTLPTDRGLYEPSLTAFGERYFLTMRADRGAFIARSEDGLNYETPIQWMFDDGKPLGVDNTQQHWATHSDGLYLVYTRKGAQNDHVFRHRAPLFIARVDPQRLCILRATEQVLVPESGLDLGNFGVMDVSPSETWVITSEMSFPKTRLDDPNHVLVAKLHWAKPNTLFRPDPPKP
jgi:hypothetical protein